MKSNDILSSFLPYIVDKSKWVLNQPYGKGVMLTRGKCGRTRGGRGVWYTRFLFLSLLKATSIKKMLNLRPTSWVILAFDKIVHFFKNCYFFYFFFFFTKCGCVCTPRIISPRLSGNVGGSEVGLIGTVLCFNI